MKVSISKKDLEDAARNDIISTGQAGELWDELRRNAVKRTSFSGVNVAFYFGAFIIILAMTWFATEAFANFSSLGLLVISLIYFVGFLLAGRTLYKNPSTRLPGGLLITVSVFMVPLFVISCQHYAGVWGADAPGGYDDFSEWIKGGWFFAEICTVLTTLIFLNRFRFPFLTFPLALTLWFFSMDITPLILGESFFTWDGQESVSIVFGLIMLLITYFIDRRTEEDFAFWLYLFGLMAFWGGLTIMGSESELGRFFYFCINLGLVILSVLFQRRVFMVFGAVGAFGYLGHLSLDVFGDSILFPIVLTLFGLIVIWLGIKYARNQERINSFVNTRLPQSVLALLPPSRE